MSEPGKDNERTSGDLSGPGNLASVLSWLLESKATTVEAVAEGTGLPLAGLLQWMTSESDPAPAEVFALERYLDVRPGTLSRHLGYIPNPAPSAATDTQLAIATDPMLPEFGKQILLFTYRNLLGSSAPDPAIAATASGDAVVVNPPIPEDVRPDAERIRTRREELGISQRFVAERLGVSQPLVSKWEKGVRIPDEMQLLRLCRVLRIDYRGLAAETAREPLPPPRKGHRPGP